VELGEERAADFVLHVAAAVEQDHAGENAHDDGDHRHGDEDEADFGRIGELALREVVDPPLHHEVDGRAKDVEREQVRRAVEERAEVTAELAAERDRNGLRTSFGAYCFLECGRGHESATAMR
jgi:hypothetical protein